MKRLLTYLLLTAMALAFCILTRQCERRHSQDLSVRRAEEVKRVEDTLRKTGEFLQPDTGSDIRFGHKANTP